MSIDLLINKYKLRLKKMDKLPLDHNIDGWSLLFSAFFSFFIYFYFYFLYENEVFLLLISFGFVIAFTIAIGFSSNSASQRQKWINNEEIIINSRISELLKLFNEYSIPITEEKINELVKAAKNNKDKYDSSYVIKRFSKLIKVGMSVFVTALFGITNLDITIGLNTFATLVFGFFICWVLFSLIYIVFVTLFDPSIRSMYYFHDSFIYDVKQIITFMDYYKTNEETKDLFPKDESDKANKAESTTTDSSVNFPESKESSKNIEATKKFPPQNEKNADNTKTQNSVNSSIKSPNSERRKFLKSKNKSK